MDWLKEIIADGVFNAVKNNTAWLTPAAIDAPTVTRPDVLNTSIRVKTDHGVRYFRVQVSEML